jgi:hypothetical protein
VLQKPHHFRNPDIRWNGNGQTIKDLMHFHRTTPFDEASPQPRPHFLRLSMVPHDPNHTARGRLNYGDEPQLAFRSSTLDYVAITDAFRVKGDVIDTATQITNGRRPERFDDYGSILLFTEIHMDPDVL